MDSAPTNQHTQIRVDIFPVLLPHHLPYYLFFNSHLPFISSFFYEGELVAPEKWVWKFEMRHHYVVKFLVLF